MVRLGCFGELRGIGVYKGLGYIGELRVLEYIRDWGLECIRDWGIKVHRGLEYAG